MLDRIHSSHLGVEKCQRRARDILFWPSMNDQIKELVSRCDICLSFRNKQQKEPLKSHAIPQRPWQKVATDLFEIDGVMYICLVDYYSKFVEFTKVSDTKSATVIEWLKEQFARYGLPEEVISDNGPQYSSDVFAEFARKYEFQHHTSSPEYPQSNGMAERAVQTLKRLLKKVGRAGRDPYLAILEWRNTPLQGMGSPSQMLMGRRTRSRLPATGKLLKSPNFNDNSN
ncbi:PREDICTED: uncharacterized protein K02A2.6-like [Priapulus caudatus]|uniref:RNA-directed DNA polymerase n=1 Tax=Priapulus caudatus TaxID=37621 RepID=A0ABM1ERU1_PRICU|nr:PREDICTED: uncharacterized protein K02A2.6-like [Priapulus caudatus]